MNREVLGEENGYEEGYCHSPFNLQKKGQTMGRTLYGYMLGFITAVAWLMLAIFPETLLKVLTGYSLFL